MIELDQITVKNKTSIVEARNKIYILAKRLKFGSINAARLATMTSEISRGMVKTGQYSNILIGLDKQDQRLGLVLLFTAARTTDSVGIKGLKSVFDGVEAFQTEDGLESIKTFKFLPTPVFES